MTESEPDRNRDPGVPPPASTQWQQNGADEGGDLPLPPFFPGSEEPAEPVAEAAGAEAPWDEDAAVEEQAPRQDDVAAEEAPWERDGTVEEAAPWDADATVEEESPWEETAPVEEGAPWDAGTAVQGGASEDQPFPFDDMGASAQEPPAEEPWDEAASAYPGAPFLDSEQTPAMDEPPVENDVPMAAGMAETGFADSDMVDEFPVDAFHLPGSEFGAGSPAPTARHQPSFRALDLADRLDRLAEALRSRGTAALTDQLAGGDRFDAVLTGLLAGFLAAGDE